MQPCRHCLRLSVEECQVPPSSFLNRRDTSLRFALPMDLEASIHSHIVSMTSYFIYEQHDKDTTQKLNVNEKGKVFEIFFNLN